MILKTILTLLLFPVFCIAGSYVGTSMAHKSEVGSVESINYENLYREIIKQGIEYPDIVFAQAVLESGHFRSKVYRFNNNTFGMRMPRVRETVALKSLNGYAVYSDWQGSVEDYKLYQEYCFKDRKVSRKYYYQYLDRIYCKAGKNYSTKVKSVIRSMDKYISSPPDSLIDGKISKKCLIEKGNNQEDESFNL